MPSPIGSFQCLSRGPGKPGECGGVNAFSASLVVKPRLHLQPHHLDQLCAFPTSRPLSFFSFCVVSLMFLTRIGNCPCDPQRQRERGGLHQRAERSGWAAGICLGRWRSLRALGWIAGILHRLTLRGPFSFDFSFPDQTLSAITSSEHFYPFLYGTYLVRLLHFTFQSCLLISSSFFISQVDWQEWALASLWDLEQITRHLWICFLICKMDNDAYPPPWNEIMGHLDMYTNK